MVLAIGLPSEAIVPFMSTKIAIFYCIKFLTALTVMVYNRSMEKQTVKDSIKIGLLIAALFFIFGVAIPFIMSDEADELILRYGLEKFALKLLGR
jgi:hypothetical protein